MQRWLSLAAICLALGALLGFTQWQTAPAITANRQAQALAELRRLLAPLPIATATAEHAQATLTNSGFWPMCHQVTVAQAVAKGYGGPITLYLRYQPGECTTLGCAPPQIKRLHVIQHTETPGIGDFFERRQPQWLAQVAKQLALGEVGTIDAVTGATITANAIVAAVRANATSVSAVPFATQTCHSELEPNA